MKVESFKHACELQGYDADAVLPDVANYPEKHQSALIAFAQLVIITEAINEGKEFDWDDYNQRKWYPWFDMEKDEEVNPSGFRFHGTDYADTCTLTAGGSRLCYHTSEDAKYVGETFIDLWRAINVISK